MRSVFRHGRHVVFAALAAACVAVGVLNVQAWRGELVDQDPSTAAAPPGTVRTVVEEPGDARSAASLDGGSQQALPHDSSSSEPSSARISISAIRGPCWLVARAGSPGGKVLYEGVLARGRKLSFSRARVWFRLGAAGNVQLAVNGEKVPDVSGGTVDLIATTSGVRTATSSPAS